MPAETQKSSRAAGRGVYQRYSMQGIEIVKSKEEAKEEFSCKQMPRLEPDSAFCIRKSKAHDDKQVDVLIQEEAHQ